MSGLVPLLGRLGPLLAVLLVVALSACSSPPTRAETVPLAEVDPSGAGGLPVREGTSGPRPGVADAVLPVAGSDGGAVDRLAVNALADVQAFWSARFPADFGTPFSPVTRLVSYAATEPGPTVCGRDTEGFANAFYCPGEDLIAWDRAALLPTLAEQLGPMAVVTVLAHEVGHAVQRRVRQAEQPLPTLLAEQQADCFAGSFIRHVAEGRAAHFQLSTGSGLNQVLAAVFELRDDPSSAIGTLTPHGTAFDRIAAFQTGFGGGPIGCDQMTSLDVVTRVAQPRIPFAPDDGVDEAPITVRTVLDLEAELRESFVDLLPQPPRLELARGCPGGPPTPAAYCPAVNRIAVDVGALAAAGAPQDRGGRGDFAAVAVLASRYALAVQRAAGQAMDGRLAGVRNACLVGAFTGTLLDQPFNGQRPASELRISAGDLDEAIAELLTGNLVAADVAGRPVPSGFARVEAFRAGFLSGTAACV